MVLWISNIVLGQIFKLFADGKNPGEQMYLYGIEIWISNFLNVGILFYAAFLIARNSNTPGYWKIALSLIGITVIWFHLGYVYWVIDYYFIQGLTPPKNLDPMQELDSFFDPNISTPPFYKPVEHFLQPFINVQYREYRRNFELLIFGFLFGSLTMPLWVSAVMYSILKRKRSISVKTENAESETQSTSDNE
jgi:hypothetical protein